MRAPSAPLDPFFVRAPPSKLPRRNTADTFDAFATFSTTQQQQPRNTNTNNTNTNNNNNGAFPF